MKRFPRFLLVTGIGLVGFLILSGDMFSSVSIGLFFGLMSLAFDTKQEREEKAAAKKAKEEAKKAEEEARKRQEEAEERARKAPGCRCMGNVDIMGFWSTNNLLTVGNNWIKITIRNRNPYDVVARICFKYSDSEGWCDARDYRIPGNQLKIIETSGKAWHRAEDVSIKNVY